MKSLNKRMQEGVDLARHPEIQWWVVTGRFLDAAHQLNPPSISQAAPPPRIRHRPRTLTSNQGFVASQCMVSLLAQNNPSALWQCAMLQVLNPWCGWEVKYCNNQGCPCHKLRNMFECEQLNLFKKKWKYCVFYYIVCLLNLWPSFVYPNLIAFTKWGWELWCFVPLPQYESAQDSSITDIVCLSVSWRRLTIRAITWLMTTVITMTTETAI